VGSHFFLGWPEMTHPALRFGGEQGGGLTNFCPGWPPIPILLISASPVARITGMSHRAWPHGWFSIHSSEYSIQRVSHQPDAPICQVLEGENLTGHLLWEAS
jgi:hypothetical protein